MAIAGGDSSVQDDLILIEKGAPHLYHRMAKQASDGTPAGPSRQDSIIEGDLRYGNRSTSSSVHDPLLLQDRRMDDEHIATLKSTRKGRKLAAHYERQNELIDELLKPPGFIDEGEEGRLLKVKIALYGTVCVNIVLMGLQLFAAIQSKSLSIFATMADAFMDLASNAVLIYTNRVAKPHSTHAYPTGKKRMETAGILVFACIMSALSVQLILEAVKALINNSVSVVYDPLSLMAIGIAIACKIGLFIYCYSLRQYPTARVLLQDHRNDVFLNGFGLALSVMGAKIANWIDPVGAILIALLIFRSWASTCYGRLNRYNSLVEQVQMIVGKTADPSFLQKITYIALTHDPRVVQVDTCRAYHSGEGFFVEVDIVLPPDMPLMEAHDIGENLQIKLESIPNVERCFVHLDYESDHAPEHRKSK